MSKYTDSYNSHKRSRRHGRNYTGKCDVRLDKTEDRFLNELAENNNKTRSDIMRRALRDYYEYCFDKKIEEDEDVQNRRDEGI